MIERDWVTVVSGIPRSGTSLMMRMLDAGGIAALTDGKRLADTHNPHGYFEYEPVKRLATDASWMESARGKSIKVIYRLLRFLPAGIPYRVVLMQRDLHEVFDSQRDMLRDRGDEAAGQAGDRLIAVLAAELEETRKWLTSQAGMEVFEVRYADLVGQPAVQAKALSGFLGGDLDEEAMAAAVDPSLYRHRRLIF
jgi:hypothetical protein